MISGESQTTLSCHQANVRSVTLPALHPRTSGVRMGSPRLVTGPCGTADPGRRRKSMPLDRSCFSFQIDLAFWFFLFYWRLQNCLFVGALLFPSVFLASN